MRLLIWSEFYWPYLGGVEVLSTRLAGALAQRGHEVAVVTSRGSLDVPDDDEHEGVAIHRVPFGAALAGRDAAGLLACRRRVARLKTAFRPDLVHATLVSPSVFFELQTRRVAPAPLLLTQQMSLAVGQDGAADTVLGRILREADHVVGCAASVIAELTAIAPDIAGRRSVIRNGVDPAPDDAARLPVDPATLLCLGRLVPGKGFHRAIDALPRVLLRHPDTRLVIAGDGPARADLERRSRDRGVADSVTFTGWVAPAAVPGLMDEATILLLPSDAEALPMVIIEAAHRARPSIATDVGGVGELIDDGRTGTLIPPGRTDALAESIVALLDAPALAAAMGRSARSRARAEFTWTTYVDRYEALYRALVAGRQEAAA